jgi:hypothetical protein
LKKVKNIGIKKNQKIILFIKKKNKKNIKKKIKTIKTIFIFFKNILIKRIKIILN